MVSWADNLAQSPNEKLNLVATEHEFCSPKYGIKGIADATMMTPLGDGQNMATVVELKTGSK